MNAKDYAEKNYPLHPSFQKIAIDAFNAGLGESHSGKEFKKLQRERNEAVSELKHLWDTLNDPEACGELLAGI